jgi:NAD(P)H-hydrate repair Nnr-like enzyme with NAD(P)H-hydrate dehydratase domain
VVLDADALRHLPGRLHPKVLLTPHAGELARMLWISRAEVESDPVRHVRAAANRWNAVVLLKGATQFVAVPGPGPVHLPVPGPAWAAQAGSGDVLAGICGALLAAGVPVPQAALLGASIQQLAYQVAAAPVPPPDLHLPIPELLAGALG